MGCNRNTGFFIIFLMRLSLFMCICFLKFINKVGAEVILSICLHLG